jgi:hypothetical protein
MKRHTTTRILMNHQVNLESTSGVADTCSESTHLKVPASVQSKPIRSQRVTAPVIRANTISLGTSQEGQVRVAFFDCE